MDRDLIKREIAVMSEIDALGVSGQRFVTRSKLFVHGMRLSVD